jgi:Tfp pilus assembly protein PilN
MEEQIGPDNEIKKQQSEESFSIKIKADVYSFLKSYKEAHDLKGISEAILDIISKQKEYEKRASDYESRIKDLEEKLKSVPEDIEKIKEENASLRQWYQDFQWIDEALSEMMGDVPGEEIAKTLRERGPYRAAVLAVRGGWDDNSIKSMIRGLPEDHLQIAKMEAISEMLSDYVQMMKEEKGVVRREARIVTKAEPIELQDIQNVRASPIVNIYYSLAKTEYMNKTGRELPFETFIEECVIYTMNRKGYYLTFVTPGGEGIE